MMVEVPEMLQRMPAEQERPPGEVRRGYVRMAVMDGKTIGHRVRIELTVT